MIALGSIIGVILTVLAIMYAFGAFTRFKEGDLIIIGTEEWEHSYNSVFKVSKVGKSKYQVIYIFPEHMRGFVTTRNKAEVNCNYRKYTGSLENVEWDKVK